jgi:hypothetical protein
MKTKHLLLILLLLSISIIGTSQVNVAKNCATSGCFSSPLMVDGNTSTQYVKSCPTGSTTIFDLGASYNISQVQLLNCGNITSVVISYSSNQTTWTNSGTLTLSSGSVTNNYSPAVACRYLKVMYTFVSGSGVVGEFIANAVITGFVTTSEIGTLNVYNNLNVNSTANVNISPVATFSKNVTVNGTVITNKVQSSSNSSYYLDLSSAGISLKIPGNIESCGSIYAEYMEVKDVCPADFVFDEGYLLRPLPEVESFIIENRHLPDVPSGDEMKKGIGLAQMNSLLLQKIEELTLYMISQHKDIEALKTEVERLKSSQSR